MSFPWEGGHHVHTWQVFPRSCLNGEMAKGSKKESRGRGGREDRFSPPTHEKQS